MKRSLTLAQANAIAAAALEQRHATGLKPLSVAVLNAGGLRAQA